MNLIKWLFRKREKRVRVQDAKEGDMVAIEWDRIEGGIGHLLCLNNDLKTNKILLRVRWSNHKEVGCTSEEIIILSYKDKRLRNFHLLNKNKIKIDSGETKDIAKLQEELNNAIAKEQYELAKKIQTKIDKLLKNGKK